VIAEYRRGIAADESAQAVAGFSFFGGKISRRIF